LPPAPTAPRAAPRALICRPVPDSWFLIKRITDVVLACAGLVLTAPVLLAAVAAIAVSSKGSPLFTQPRVGRSGRRFWVYKLRTMHVNAHRQLDALHELNEASGPVFKIKNDPRCFAVGSFLRRTSIDELPNLINVLRGEMSIVGPRPALPHEVEQYTGSALARLHVKPGITCIWQISGRSTVSFERWIQLDREYVETWTPLRDLGIILRTIPAVLFGQGAY
jgi:lipopolysaccharide/colanic/teichoic acid biosynthesis glycosyltransferase